MKGPEDDAGLAGKVAIISGGGAVGEKGEGRGKGRAGEEGLGQAKKAGAAKSDKNCVRSARLIVRKYGHDNAPAPFLACCSLDESRREGRGTLI